MAAAWLSQACTGANGLERAALAHCAPLTPGLLQRPQALLLPRATGRALLRCRADRGSRQARPPRHLCKAPRQGLGPLLQSQQLPETQQPRGVPQLLADKVCVGSHLYSFLSHM